MKNGLFLALLFAQQVFGSALFDKQNANFWLVEGNGAISSYTAGEWLDQFDDSVYTLGQGEQVLINILPHSSIPMDTQLAPVSISGLGGASLGAGDTGGDKLLVQPVQGDYTETIEVLMLADVDLVDTYGSLTLLWQVNGGAFSYRVFDSSSESADGFFETSFFLVNNGTHNVHVELLDNNNVELVTLDLVYNITSNHPDGESRDSDQDGLPDLVELAIGLNPLQDDWQTDANSDGWSDFDQWLRSETSDHTELPVDTDRDGWSDVDEIWRGTNPVDTVSSLATADPAHPAPVVDTQRYRDALLSFKVHPVVSRLYEVEYLVTASKQSGLDALSWNATASSYSLTGDQRFDSVSLLSPADLAWADVGPSNIAVSLKQSTFDSALQLDQAKFRVSASLAQVMDVIADETIILNPGTVDEKEALRRWHYQTLLEASPDLTPVRFTSTQAWTTAEEWKQQYITHLEQNLVVDQVPLLSLDHNLYIEAFKLMLAYEIKLQGGSGVFSWDAMDTRHQHIIRQLQDSLSNRENGRNLYQVYMDLRSLLQSNSLTQSYGWLQNLQSSVTEAVDVSYWLQQQALASVGAEMNSLRFLSRYTLFANGLSSLAAQPDLEIADNDTDGDGLVNKDEVEKPFAISTYSWSTDTDGDLIIDSSDSCPTDADPGCDTLPLLRISTSFTIDEPQSGQTQNLLIGFQLDRIYDHDVSFRYTVTASASETATAGVDFTQLSDSLVISAGQQVVFITVSILPDSDYTEGNESFHIELFDIYNALVVDSSVVINLIPAVLIPDTDARLAGLQLSAGVLSPTFAASTFSYATTVADTVTSITFTPTVWDVNASVTVNGMPVTSGNASAAIALNVGVNVIQVEVTAVDGITVFTYSISVTRETPPVLSYSVGGTVSGLTGTVVLLNNSADTLSLTANGSFTFSTALADNASYSVSISTHPSGQTCSVNNGSGSIAAANVTNVSIICVDDVVYYTVGGTVSGLTGTLVLQNNATDDLTLLANGSFIFVTSIADGTNYVVTVSNSPAGQSCRVTNGSGSIAGANVATVSIACSDLVSITAGIFIEPMSLYASSATALGDVDGDGDLDLVAAWGETTVWLNNGIGGLVDSGQVLGSSVGSLELGDVDGDGDLDLMMTGTNNTVWFNDGDGAFSDSGQTLGTGASSISVGDVDGDGDLDLVAAYGYGYNGPHNVWLNDGAGVFSDSGLDFGTWERIQSITLGDMDGDGDLDLVEVCAYCPERIWFNDGSGVFTDSGQTLGTDNTRSVVLGDIDGDGDLDMVKANGNGGNPVWINDGNGIFSDSGQSLVGVTQSTYSLTLGDVDNDGDLDLMEANGDGGVSTFNSLWLNDGNGIFTDSGQSFHSANAAGSALFGDMDGDGDLDLVMDHAFGTSWTAGAMSVFINSGVGIFTDSIQFIGDDATQSVALGDIDGDGDLDLVEGNYAESAYYDKVPNTIKLNNGDGSFTDSGQLLGFAETNSVALGDVDGDNDLDLVAGNNVGSNKVWLNDGIGIFIDSGQALGDSNNSTTWSVALGDVDGDGDLDLVAGNLRKRNTTWFNDGAGTFTLSQFLGDLYGSSSTRSILLGDVDGDGDLDLVEGNSSSEPNTVWLNDGAGLFTDSGQTLGSNNTYALALEDVDVDGDLDLVEGNYGTEPNTVWFNNGAGIFTDSGQALGSSPTNSVTLGDMDGDGDLDLVAGNYLEPDTIWINSGAGTFTDSGHALGYYFPLSVYFGTQSVTLGDVDDDGDLDLVTGNAPVGGSQSNVIYLNQTP